MHAADTSPMQNLQKKGMSEAEWTMLPTLHQSLFGSHLEVMEIEKLQLRRENILPRCIG